MLKKFTRDQTSSNNRAKSSIYKKLRRAILENYPQCEDLIDDVFPKKGVMNLATCKTLKFIQQQHILAHAHALIVLLYYE